MTPSINYKTSPSTKNQSTPKPNPSLQYIHKAKYLTNQIFSTIIKIYSKKPNPNSFLSTKNPNLLTSSHPLPSNKQLKMESSGKTIQKSKENNNNKMPCNYSTVQVK